MSSIPIVPPPARLRRTFIRLQCPRTCPKAREGRLRTPAPTQIGGSDHIVPTPTSSCPSGYMRTPCASTPAPDDESKPVERVTTAHGRTLQQSKSSSA